MDKPGITWELLDEQSPAESAGPGPGARLRAARERAGWTPETVAAELKVPPARVVDLESDRFEAFGPPVFVRGYLRRYAVLLGIDAAEVLAMYEGQAQADAPQAQIGLAPGRPPRPDRGRWLGPSLVGVVVAGVLAGGWWFFAPGPGPEGPSAGTPSPAASAPLALEQPVPAEGQALPAATDEPPGAPVESVAEAPTEPEPDLAPAEPGAVAGPDEPEAASTVAASLASGDGGQDAGTGPDARQMPPPGQADIRIALEEDCWLEIVDAGGRRLAYRLGRAGESIRVRGTAPVSLFLGNAEGVELTVDGEPVAVRPAARRDGTARLTVGGGAG